jgi:tetratricopeptide (TPR) repeat protein
MNQVFIARDEQLKQLTDWLGQTVRGEGRVCFVSGEAGSGKTTLVNKFTRQAQENDKNLAVAVGLCDAQTGIGDAYLPFREVLGQLTGDVENKLAQGAITQENAGRLRSILALAGQAIVDVGPDLVGVFVPGVGLATKLGAFMAEKAGWLEKLDKLADKPKQKVGESGIDESHIFEQFANVLCRIAESKPLLILLDDLHWADAASINLLFHLGRRIGEHPILILGTYRSAEVAIGRGGERHPLEKVLAEFKRYFGEMTIDLDQAVEAEGEAFVSEFVATEPNKLDGSFKRQLFKHTGGHPLFTVELLRNMQERGDLVKDEEGKWIESASLDWEDLPTRVEGVIEERIGRLETDLKEVLTVGSVQGEDFTAEVVARVQEAEARGLIRQLSGELERQHRLVKAEGTRRLADSKQRLSLFRFQHNLFRTYLYNELGEAERAYLHEDVGAALEALYGDQADEIAVQLAHHYEKAGLQEKAQDYLQKAGEQAATRYANEEAIDHFTRALELTPKIDLERQYELLTLREQIYSLKGEIALQAKDLEELWHISEELNDDKKYAEVSTRKASYALSTGDFPGALEAARLSIKFAERCNDTALLGLGNYLAGDSSMRLSQNDDAREYFTRALEISKELRLNQLESGSLRGLGVIAYNLSDFELSLKYNQESLEISDKSGDRIGSSKTLNNLGFIYRRFGDIEMAKECLRKAISVFRDIGDLRREAVVLGNLGAAYANQGKLQEAKIYFHESFEASKKVGDQESLSIMLANLGNLSAQTGDFNSALDYLEKAKEINQQIGNKYYEADTIWSMGMVLNKIGHYDEALKYLHKSIEMSQEFGIKTTEENGYLELGRLYDSVGQYSKAEEYLDAGYQIILEVKDLGNECDYNWQKALLYLHVEKDIQSQELSLKAIDQAKQIGDQELEASALLINGHSQVALGNLIDAREKYLQSLSIRESMDQVHLLPEPKSGLAKVAMLEGDKEEALEYVESILNYLEEHNFDGSEEPYEIYLTCFRVLEMNKDPRAGGVIKKAYTLVMEQANSMEGESIRESFLENVEANKEIIKTFENLEGN